MSYEGRLARGEISEEDIIKEEVEEVEKPKKEKKKNASK